MQTVALRKPELPSPDMLACSKRTWHRTTRKIAHAPRNNSEDNAESVNAERRAYVNGGFEENRLPEVGKSAGH